MVVYIVKVQKMINIFYGKQSCSSTHPCYVCPATKNDFWNPNLPLENPESAMRNYNSWIANGEGIRSDLKDYNSQEFPPVGVEHMSEDELQEPNLLRTPPPPVHLLLSTNHLVQALEKKWEFGVKRWMRQAFQSFRDYFGKTLEGNQCSSLISNYGILEKLVENYGRRDLMCFVKCFKNLNAVKTAVFGLRLDPNYVAIINDFQDSLVALDEYHKVSITVKFHMICVHVKQYCQMTNKSLQLNEQSLESSHSRFKKIVNRFAGANPDTDSPLYALNVLRALEFFCSAAAFRDSL